jgi:hypothetical protein
MKRIMSGVGIATVGVLGWGTLAFAGGHAPSITPTQATFIIGPGSVKGTVWTLNLWSKGNRDGSDTGTTGTLTVAVPATRNCAFQADVLRNGKWFSGNDATFTSCGGVAPTTSTTTSTTTTTTKPPTSTKGGHKPKGGHTPPVNKLVTSSTPDPVTKAALSASKPAAVSSSRLAFTGVGPALWILTLVGSGLLVAGGTLILRRPRLRR